MTGGSNPKFPRAIAILAIVLAMLSTVTTGKIIYVDDDATGTNDGSSWADAYNCPLDALSEANVSEKPAAIWIAQGIYKPDQGKSQIPGDREATFQLINGVTILGGFAGVGEINPDDRNIEAYRTILCGDLKGDDIVIADPYELLSETTRGENSYHVVTGNDTDSTAVINGFTIVAGNANGTKLGNSFDYNYRLMQGGGMYNFSGSPCVVNCTFTENSAKYGGGICNASGSSPMLSDCTFISNFAGRYGGGMDNCESEPTLANCIFSDNSASWGGGLSNRIKSNVTLTDCIFSRNKISWYGGGMANRDSDPILTNCTFNRNEAKLGGGMHNSESSPTLTNCKFTENVAYCQYGLYYMGTLNGYGGGMHNSNSTPTLINCTFSENHAGECVGGISNLESCPILTNCILWGNSLPQISGDAIISYSNIQDGWLGEGNIDVDPLFVYPGYWHLNGTPEDVSDDFWIEGDYHLKSQAGRWDPITNSWVIDEVTSPCIDAGDPTILIDSELFPNGDTINMGVYGGTVEASKSLSSIDIENGGGPVKPNFTAYYEPWEYAVEPNMISYELPLDLNKLTNYDRVNQKLGLDSVKDLIGQNGFVVIEHDIGWYDPTREDIAKPYEYLRDEGIPMFVTADTLLHLYHVQFDESLKDIEEREFFDDILMLTETLLDDALGLYNQLEGDLKEAARRNVAYLAVAAQLIGSSFSVPEIASNEVSSELNKIEEHSGFIASDIFTYKEDYSQYVPRGHYTRSEKLKKYFKALMWYGRMAFLLKGHENYGQSAEALINPYNAKIQTLQAYLLAISLNTQHVNNRSASEVWNRIYTVTAFYVGLSDDLTPYDYLWALEQVFGQEYVLEELDDPIRLHELKMELALLPAPKIYGGTGDVNVPLPITEESLNEILDKTKGMRLMGQRFIPDSYMLQNMIFPKVEDYIGDINDLPFTSVVTLLGTLRGYPRGLDVMALLGSQEARSILVQEGDTDYIGYWDRFNELADEFGVFSREDWNRNLYWGWLYSLQALISGYGEGYPAFMRSSAWSKRSLNAALASWTELRHDTILYAKQGYLPMPPFSESTPICYIEPVPEFFGRLLALTKMTFRGLSDMAVLSGEARDKLVSFEELLSRLIEISTKHLTNESLSYQDYSYLNHLAERLEELGMGVNPAEPWMSTGLKTTLVADVHTCGAEEKVLEEGVGKVDMIVVACPRSDGSAFLAAGPVLSYYEFKHPMDDRLTDEKWRELLDSPDKPERPAWYRSLMR